MATVKSDGSVTAPQVGPNQGGATPNRAPNTKPAEVKSSPIMDGPPNSLVEQSAGGNPYNKDGFVGVDPQFQQYSSDVDKPL